MLHGGDTYCLQARDFPGRRLGTDGAGAAGGCARDCKFLEGVASAADCRDAIRASNCSAYFSWRESDGRCWGKSAGAARRARAGLQPSCRIYRCLYQYIGLPITQILEGPLSSLSKPSLANKEGSSCRICQVIKNGTFLHRSNLRVLSF